jgi:polyisoprenoid-binding protein YceI
MEATTKTMTPAGVTTWTIDPSHSNVEFAVKHLMISTVRGRMTRFTGELTLDEANPARSSVRAEVDAASIDTRDDRRDEHLRSADFFDVANHPTVTFASRAFDGDAREGWRMTGDLTIRGVTRSVTLDVTESGAGKDPWGGERRGFAASTVVDRRDFGLNWNQALETGGVVVGHDVKITMDVEAVRQVEAAPTEELQLAGASLV